MYDRKQLNTRSYSEPETPIRLSMGSHGANCDTGAGHSITSQRLVSLSFTRYSYEIYNRTMETEWQHAIVFKHNFVLFAFSGRCCSHLAVSAIDLLICYISITASRYCERVTPVVLLNVPAWDHFHNLLKAQNVR